jgi:hypothetical protein
MNNLELRQLIEIYNQVELEQRARLLLLFRAVRDRSGSGRFVRFGNGRRWGVNDFQPMEEKFSVPVTVDSMVETIGEFNLGDE